MPLSASAVRCVSPLATWFAGTAALRNFRCGVGSGGARRLSLGVYVTCDLLAYVRIISF